MANNSIPTGTKVRHCKPKYYVEQGAHSVDVTDGVVIAQSKYGDEWVVVEWNDKDGIEYPVSSEHVDDLIEIP
jgi:hypothetical protein